MSRPLAIANGFKIPTFIIFDGDVDKKTDEEIKQNKRDNTCILNLSSAKGSDPLSEVAIWGKNIVMWSSRIETSVKKDFGDEYEKVKQKVIKDNGWEGVSGKNPSVITATIEELYKAGKRSEKLLTFPHFLIQI